LGEKRVRREATNLGGKCVIVAFVLMKKHNFQASANGLIGKAKQAGFPRILCAAERAVSKIRLS
jgi:fructose-1-phosphate kinase PfkB-like protein